jgi:hypothetical protein
MSLKAASEMSRFAKAISGNAEAACTFQNILNLVQKVGGRSCNWCQDAPVSGDSILGSTERNEVGWTRSTGNLINSRTGCSDFQRSAFRRQVGENLFTIDITF